MSGRLILVSNRLPVTAQYQGQELTLLQSGGGLATGLKGARAREGSTWVGWPGEVPAGTRCAPSWRRSSEKQGLRPIFLTRAELKGFYEDYSNGAVWPVFHDLIDQLPLQIPAGRCRAQPTLRRSRRGCLRRRRRDLGQRLSPHAATGTDRQSWLRGRV